MHDESLVSRKISLVVSKRVPKNDQRSGREKEIEHLDKNGENGTTNEEFLREEPGHPNSGLDAKIIRVTGLSIPEKETAAPGDPLLRNKLPENSVQRLASARPR